ncbi:hypothetical protein CARUB_v10022486mg [Capsella rubella]|uniref:Uncharacterized protein n=1 Tax=Capsella rubella TaxID=81985 RepID=R0I9W2_9BRAS|nr:hypothetical protein CARUB_v10022486mg [Capsella rubella]
MLIQMLLSLGRLIMLSKILVLISFPLWYFRMGKKICQIQMSNLIRWILCLLRVKEYFEKDRLNHQQRLRRCMGKPLVAERAEAVGSEVVVANGFPTTKTLSQSKRKTQL